MNKKFNKRMKKPLALLISRNRNSGFFSVLAKLSQSYLKNFENNNNDHFTNGESRVLAILSEFSPKVIFDVGANVGDWSILAASLTKEVKIFSFEPIPETFHKLKEKTKHDSSISIYNFGLSDQSCSSALYYKPGKSLFTSEIPFEKDIENMEKIEVKFQDGRGFCVDHAIQAIDFLKIDVEGAEPKVLSGFKEMLEKGGIKMIQFEYSTINIKSKFLLYDFYQLLTPLGFQIGKIYPRNVDFRFYDTSMEDFMGLNYLAVHESVAKEWIPKLRGC